MSRSIRPFALFVALATAALPFVHGFAALVRAVVPGPPAALALSAACLAVCGCVAILAGSERPKRSWPVSTLTGVFAGCALLAAFGASGVALSLALSGPLIGMAAQWWYTKLPKDLETLAARRPWLAATWILLGSICVAQTARISSFMSDDSLKHGPTIAGFWDHHMCLPAYLQAAEMNSAGEANVYHPSHYPGVTRDATSTTEVVGMQKYVEDPYLYPPQFLMLPHALLATGLDFATLRTVWFAAQALLFFATAIALSRFVGVRREFRVLARMPLVWVAPVTMYNFQYGQAHLAVLCIAVLAMLAFESRRDLAGGVLLASAVLAKLFPALLLIPLLLERRWRALGTTAAAAVLITAASLPVIGTAPYVSFFEYHLPRLLSGESFAFQEAWPELAAELIASNQSVKGFVDKLELLGWSLAANAQTWLSMLYAVATLGLVACASMRAATSGERATLWLGALTLGALASSGAWSDYVLVSAVWMLAMIDSGRRMPRIVHFGLATAWILFTLQPGVMPLIPIGSEDGKVIAALVGYIAVLAFCATQLMRRRPANRLAASRTAVRAARIT